MLLPLIVWSDWPFTCILIVTINMWHWLCQQTVCSVVKQHFTPPLIGKRSIVMSMCVSVCVCLCVCFSAITFLELHIRSSPCVLCVLPMAMARSSSGGVMIRYTYIQIYIAPKIVRRCTSCFMDDIIFAHRPMLLDVAPQLKRSAHAALGLAIKCVQ